MFRLDGVTDFPRSLFLSPQAHIHNHIRKDLFLFHDTSTDIQPSPSFLLWHFCSSRILFYKDLIPWTGHYTSCDRAEKVLSPPSIEPTHRVTGKPLQLSDRLISRQTRRININSMYEICQNEFRLCELCSCFEVSEYRIHILSSDHFSLWREYTWIRM